MCRIAGKIARNSTSEQLIEEVKAMCRAMAHGGPDDEGFTYIAEQGMVLGHRRLALIDLSDAGHQPMCYQEKAYTIIFNGEIYNYLELKQELQSLGFGFTTASDTEVILASFACWGTASFEKLSGMFAFAIYDQQRGITYLVRDRSGIKPLYYATLNEELIFASEVMALKPLLDEENPDWRIYFLAFGHIPEPFTTQKDVVMLPKSHYLKWDHQTSSSELFSFEKAVEPAITDPIIAKIAVEQTLKSAVSSHLISDAPIGIFLSGGIDSSIITCLAHEIQLQKQQPLHAISINFDDVQYSEQTYQQLIIDKIKGDHANYLLDQQTFSEHFPSALAAMDQPTADGINSWFINYYAKLNGLKAVLSGIGADEIFGGYPSFKRMGWLNEISKLPNFLLKAALKFGSPVLKRLYYLSYGNTVGKYLCLRGVFTPDEIGKLLDISIEKVDQVLKKLSIPELPSNLTNAEQASWLETNLYMQNQLLKDTDSMSMKHGVEVRVPFLDQKLMAMVASISASIKFRGKKQKGLLIDSFIHLLPQQIWDRPKMGFTFPFQQWLNEDQYFQSKLAKCKNSRANTLIAKFKNNELHWSKAMAIYQVFNHGEK